MHSNHQFVKDAGPNLPFDEDERRLHSPSSSNDSNPYESPDSGLDGPRTPPQRPGEDGNGSDTEAKGTTAGQAGDPRDASDQDQEQTSAKRKLWESSRLGGNGPKKLKPTR